MSEEMSDRANRSVPPPWTRHETVAICAMLLVSLVTHFYRIHLPAMPVYDEHIYVEEAYKYLAGEPFFEVHPPLAIVLIVACARVFGCHIWSWRISSAIIGAALIPITYLLARRMFHSRLAATLAALLVMCEGMFLVYSRLALINILYVTLGAASYLALFRFMQIRDTRDRRRSLTWLGILLGLGLGAKLLIPGVAVVIAAGFLIGTLAMESLDLGPTHEKPVPSDLRYTVGALALVGSLSGIFFLLTFLPNYLIGWWTGISSLTSYYRHVVLVNQNYPNPVTHQDSPWWTWPLMLHPYEYAVQGDGTGNYFVVWGGGNAAIWWAALMAMVLSTIRALRRKGVAWAFLIIGYLLYMAMWIPVHRALYLYSYMPAYYLGILALAGILDDCWKETAQVWERSVMLLPVFAVLVFGCGYLEGAIASGFILASYAALTWRSNWSGRFVFTALVAATIVVFIYFLPLWIPFSISESAIKDRMWFDAAGIGEWL